MATAAATANNNGTETASVSASRGFVALVASLAGAGVMHLAESGDRSPKVDIGAATAAAESRAQQVVRDESARLSADLDRNLAAHRAEIAGQIKAVADGQADQARTLVEIGKAVARIEGQLQTTRK